MKRLLFVIATLSLCLSVLAEEEQKLRIGDIAPAFTAQDTLGNNISLSDYKGKYVIIDFWASWCPDCRREIPALKKLCKKYEKTKLGKEKAGIAFLSVSFDHDAESWKSLLRKEQFTWPQISNGIPWKKNMNPIAQAYKLHWIPTFVLVSPEGRICGETITVSELEKLIKTTK
jgi:thiol-disulfide isomerase/thioredoxin